MQVAHLDIFQVTAEMFARIKFYLLSIPLLLNRRAKTRIQHDM